MFRLQSDYSGYSLVTERTVSSLFNGLQWTQIGLYLGYSAYILVSATLSAFGVTGEVVKLHGPDGLRAINSRIVIDWTHRFLSPNNRPRG